VTINAFNVSYDDFELGTIINPDEFDVNFADIMIRINQLIDVVNHITDGRTIENEDGTFSLSDGSDIIDIGEIAPFTSPKLQAFLEEVIARLTSTELESGASFIGSSDIPGVVGNTVQEQLESLKTLLDEMQVYFQTHVDRLDASDVAINIRIDDTNTHLDSVEARVATNEATLPTKADKEFTYTKTEIETLFYTNPQIDTLLDEKTDKTGDHVGTWQGLNVEQFADSIGASGVVFSQTYPTAPEEKMVWFNPVTNEYRIYLNGQWRIQSKPTQIKKVHNRVTLGVDTGTVSIGIQDFNPEFDAFIVTQNSAFIAEGFEYTVDETGTTIVHPDGTWDTGTIFDFVAFIAVPV
jgi:hypothetical protein